MLDFFILLVITMKIDAIYSLPFAKRELERLSGSLRGGIHDQTLSP